MTLPHLPIPPIPPIKPFSFDEWFVASRWDGQLSSAGKPCDKQDCFWRAELGVVGPHRRAVADHSLESLICASNSALPTNAYHIRKGSLAALPARDFRASEMSGEEAAHAFDELAHGDGTEPWWQLAKADRACGGLVLPMPGCDSTAALFLFDRFLDRLRLEDNAELVEISFKLP